MLDRLAAFLKLSRFQHYRFRGYRAKADFHVGKFDGNYHLEKLIQDNPKFHMLEGHLTSWSVQSDTLRYLYNLLRPGMKTLETGCGQTTVVFALADTIHTCIMPDPGEAKRVKRYCKLMGLEPNINFIIESSDTALAQNRLVPPGLDHVFIDGAHAFPAPILDWHYAGKKLKIGGILGIDDYKMPSVKILYDFLCTENEEWEFMSIFQNTAFFRKLKEPVSAVHWSGQKINASFPGY